MEMEQNARPQALIEKARFRLRPGVHVRHQSAGCVVSDHDSSFSKKNLY
jgi:hypothetical protein